MSVAGNNSGGRGPEIANWKWAGAFWGGFYSKHNRQPAPDPDGSAFDVLSSESTTQPQQGPPRRPLFFWRRFMRRGAGTRVFRAFLRPAPRVKWNLGKIPCQ